ncbi:hypothetical protein QE152_g38333 [Popillia japonica]|uniref:Uncharacterized protein n=1 Tax=Popillia japonica TaxID=7064 RepID=A0AAW1I821_POPJA
MTVLKIIEIFLLVLYAVCESCEAYHRYANIKSDQHKNSLWNNKLYNVNSASSSSTSSSSWYRNNHQYGGTTTTTTAIPHHIRHGGYNSRYPKLDGVMHRLNPSRKPKSTENTSFRGKKTNEHRWDSYYEENDYDEDDALESIDGKEEDLAEDEHKWVSQFPSIFLSFICKYRDREVY